MSPAPPPTLRLGLIGAGRFAQTHVDAFRRLEGVEIAAVCRRDPRELEAVRRRWEVPLAFADYRDLLALDAVDAVAIVTTADSHFEIARAAIAAGKHVLCEKPLTLRAAESKELLDLAERAGVVHAVNFNLRERTAIGSLGRYLESGYVGDLYHLNIWWGMCLQHDVRPEIRSWRARPETGGGTIHELIHVFDFARLLGGEVARICTMASTSEPWRPFADAPEGAPVGVPDSSSHLVEFASGATGVIHTSFVSRGIDPTGRAEPRVEASGSRGRIVTVEGQRLQGIRDAQGPLADLPVTHGPLPYEEMVNAIRGGPPVRTSFREGWKAAEIADAAFLSLAERRWVEVGS